MRDLQAIAIQQLIHQGEAHHLALTKTDLRVDGEKA
jgi:hypothetical protein